MMLLQDGVNRPGFPGGWSAWDVRRHRGGLKHDVEGRFGDVASGPNPVVHLKAEVTSPRRDTGWAPTPNLSLALADTVAWYRAHPRVFARGACS